GRRRAAGRRRTAGAAAAPGRAAAPAVRAARGGSRVRRRWRRRGRTRRRRWRGRKGRWSCGGLLLGLLVGLLVVGLLLGEAAAGQGEEDVVEGGAGAAGRRRLHPGPVQRGQQLGQGRVGVGDLHGQPGGVVP